MLFEAHDFAVHGIGCGDGPAGGVETEDDAFDGVVFFGALESFVQAGEWVFTCFEKTFGGGIVEDALDVDDGDFAGGES